MIRNEIINFQDIPKAGKAIEKDFILIGLKEPIELIQKTPYLIYGELCKITQQRHDPCVIDVFISAVNYMKGGTPKKWWEFTKDRKARMSVKYHSNQSNYSFILATVRRYPLSKAL